MAAGQKPLELILARNFLSSLSTPAFLVDDAGVLIFYNEPAGEFLGRRFEETGTMAPDQWITEFGPFGTGGKVIPLEDMPVTRALRRGRPAHSRELIRSADGVEHDIEVAALPIQANGGTRGAIVAFWPAGEGEPE